MILGQESKPSVEELAHYGVKGMKWGVRRAQDGLSDATGLQIGNRQKATGKQVVAARRRLVTQSNAYGREFKKYETAKGRKKPNAERVAQLEASLRRREKEYMNDPDRVVAARMTRGEKFFQAWATTNTGGLGLAASGAVLAGTSGVSRRIEYKQKNGGYKQRQGAVKKQLGGHRYRGLVTLGASAAPMMAAMAGQRATATILTRAANNREAAKAASKLKYAKVSRGAYKVTTMK